MMITNTMSNKNRTRRSSVAAHGSVDPVLAAVWRRHPL